MNVHTISLLVLSIVSTQVLAAQRVVVPPIEKSTGKPAVGIKKSEKVTITGALKTVPMQGAMLTLNSTNFGQVVLFSPTDVDASLEKKLNEFETSGVSLKVTGTLNTVCTDQQLKAETRGCRRFDLTKEIVVEKP